MALANTMRMKSKYAAYKRFLRSCLVVAVLFMALVAGVWRAMQLLGMGESHAAGEDTVTSVVVSTGDTLWSLAIAHGPQGEDPRKVVSQIKALNQLRSAQLRPGMVLSIPSRHME